MTKTLFILDELYPVRGAPAVRIENFMRALPAGSYTALGGITGSEAAPASYIGIPRPSERTPFRFMSFILRLGRRALREVETSVADTVLLSVPKYELLLFAPALRRRCRRLIIDIRDSLAFLDYRAYLSHFLPGAIAGICGATVESALTSIQQRALRAADLVTVANEGIARTIEHPRVVVLPNGVDTDLFRRSHRPAHDGRRPLRLGYVGNYAEKDRFEFVLEVLPQFRNEVELHLAGSGRNKDVVSRSLSERGIAVVDHGLVPHRELPRVLDEVDLGFIFRERGVDESIPVSLFEFAAMGIPSCCNDTGIMAEFVREERLGFVLANAVAFRDLLESLLREPSSLVQFEQLHEVAVNRFSLRRTAELFLELHRGTQP